MKEQRLLIGVLMLGLLLAQWANPVLLSGRAPSRPGVAYLTADQAVAAAVNHLEATADGYQLRHPRHLAAFTPDGLRFTPRHGGPEWAWQLAFVGAGDAPLRGGQLGAVWPVNDAPGAVTYARGIVVEQYLARKETIEQQFIIPQPLALNGADLVIAGAVRSAGTFEEAEDGWRWRTAEGAVRLGDVRVYDATGRDLPAEMKVTATQTRIVVDGVALARAAYPVTIDPEIGANDFRLSDMGGDTLFDAFSPAMAYNSTANEYLVVWWGDDSTGSLADGEYEIYGQRVDAATGAEIGSDFRISDMGPDGDPNFGPIIPSITFSFPASVAYNSMEDEYLVVWWSDDNTGTLVDDEFEIFGQRLDAAGNQVGTNDFRISDMGPDGSTSYAAADPAVIYNSTNNEYLVVWDGHDNTAPLVLHEFEIFGQRLDAAGNQVGTNDFRLSDMGPDGSTSYSAFFPAVAYNSTANEYLVVWEGDDNTAPLVNNEKEIFGQRLNAATGAEIGSDFRLSDMGPDGDVNYGASYAAVAYNSAANEYLVVWQGDDNTDDEFEIFGQRVDASGAEVGTDLRLSDMGPDGNTAYGAFVAAVAYNSTNNEYLVVWSGNDNSGSLAMFEQETFGQRVSAAGAEVGTNDLRLSHLGPDGDSFYNAFFPAVAYNSQANEYLVALQGDDNTAPLMNDEYEIFGQRASASGAEIGTPFRLSDMGGDTSFDASSPAVAYNSTANEYLVVWSGDDNTAPLVNNEQEIFGQRVDATGAQIGSDFRISDMGPDEDATYDAFSPALAYNSTANEYLVVWYGDDNTGSLADGEYEIYGQRVNAATGAEIGSDFRISDMGPDGNPSFDAFYPVLAYNSTANEYLVVWYGDDNTGTLVDNEFEIFGQRLDGTAFPVGANDFRISDMGPDGNPNFDASYPALAYDSTSNQYLVVWRGEDDTAPLVDNEYEIFGQRLDAATEVQVGDNDFRLSDMGPDGDANFDAYKPTVAYNSMNNEYLVVWYGDDNTGTLVSNEQEIFGQRVDATGAQIGANDFRLSDMGPDGDVTYAAFYPAVAYNSMNNEYLVVWYGDDNTGSLADGEHEIYGQRVDATGAQIGANDFRLSDMGPDGNANYDALEPVLAYNSTSNQYLVVWWGDDDTAPLVDGENEVFGQRFALGFRVYLPIILK